MFPYCGRFSRHSNEHGVVTILKKIHAAYDVPFIDDGITYDDAAILADFRAKESLWGEGNVLLFWSGDIKSFESTDYWVVIIDSASFDFDGALQWCADEQLIDAVCYAKRILVDGPIDGTTKHQKN